MRKFISLLLATITIISVLTAFAVPASAATQMTEVLEQSYVLFKNAKTGQYMNFDYGVLQNKTVVRCWPKDGSTEQIWTIKKNSNGTYRIVTYKSSNYALDVYRGSSALKAGQNIDIWKNGDDATAQNVCFYQCSNGNWIICMANNTSLTVSANGSKNQLKLSKFDASDTAQQWIPTDKNGKVIEIAKPTAKQPKVEDNKTESTLKFVMPLQSKSSTNITTQKFGAYYSAYGYHLGVDLGTSGNAATTVHAIADGTVFKVVLLNQWTGWGNLVVIKHTTPNGKVFYSAYGHMKDSSVVVKEGEKIKAGDKIGTMGSTGYSSGPHLHLTVFSGSITKSTCPQGYSNSKFSGTSVKYSGITYYDPLQVIKTGGSNIK